MDICNAQIQISKFLRVMSRKLGSKELKPILPICPIENTLKEEGEIQKLLSWLISIKALIHA